MVDQTLRVSNGTRRGGLPFQVLLLVMMMMVMMVVMATMVWVVVGMMVGVGVDYVAVAVMVVVRGGDYFVRRCGVGVFQVVVVVMVVDDGWRDGAGWSAIEGRTNENQRRFALDKHLGG